jgi:hypothetical protein
MDFMAHICKSNTWEAEAGGLQVGSQPEPHNKTLSLKTKEKHNKKYLFLFVCVIDKTSEFYKNCQS